jgi:hypothetical protein
MQRTAVQVCHRVLKHGSIVDDKSSSGCRARALSMDRKRPVPRPARALPPHRIARTRTARGPAAIPEAEAVYHVPVDARPDVFNATTRVPPASRLALATSPAERRTRDFVGSLTCALRNEEAHGHYSRGWCLRRAILGLRPVSYTSACSGAERQSGWTA